MKKTGILASVLIAVAASAYAEIKIATIDMETVILSHPQTEENKNRLLEMQREFEGRRDALRDELKALYDDLNEVMKEAQNEALSEQVRNKKRNEARDQGQTIQQKEADLRKLVNDLQRQLQEKELLLFENVMSDIRFAIDNLVKERQYDLVVDSSAIRPGAPVPIVMYAKDSLDITDPVVTSIGGTKPAVAKMP